MRRRALALALAAAVGTLVVPGSAWAASPSQIMTMSSLGFDQAEADRFFVRWLTVEEPRPAVRSAARSAYLGGDAAIAAFLNQGYDAAIERAAVARDRNVSYLTRMIATHAALYYPRVNAGGRWALTGDDSLLDYYVHTGYAADLALDRADIEHDGEQAAAIRQEDRDFVALLSEEDPGDQVRAWAGRAVAPGSTDTDVVEFFRYGWVSASGLDRQTYRARLSANDQLWRVTVNRLLAEAQAAEAAARETAGEAQVQARAAAARAWGSVSAQTGPARVAWADAEQVALRQADTWLLVQQAAASATSTNWLTIADSAQGTQAAWAAERENAALQATSWTALYQQALEAEAALSTPVS